MNIINWDELCKMTKEEITNRFSPEEMKRIVVEGLIELSDTREQIKKLEAEHEQLKKEQIEIIASQNGPEPCVVIQDFKSCSVDECEIHLIIDGNVYTFPEKAGCLVAYKIAERISDFFDIPNERIYTTSYEFPLKDPNNPITEEMNRFYLNALVQWISTIQPKATGISHRLEKLNFI